MFSSQQKKRSINTHDILSSYEHSERQKLFGDDGDPVTFFNHVICVFAYNMNQLSLLQKDLELANNQRLTVGLSISMSVTPIVAFVSVLDVRVSAVVTALETVPVPNPKLGQSDVDVMYLSNHGASPFPSPAKRVQNNSLSIPIGKGYPKQDSLVEDGERDALIYFF